jgi:hypothetical protein
MKHRYCNYPVGEAGEPCQLAYQHTGPHIDKNGNEDHVTSKKKLRKVQR